MWWWTTTPPTSTSGSRPGWRPILASNCTSPRPMGPGSTWSRCSFRSSSAKPCAAATSPASRSQSLPLTGSAMAGINAASRFAGPRRRPDPHHAHAATHRQQPPLEARLEAMGSTCSFSRDRGAVRAWITLACGQPQGRSGFGAGVLGQGGGGSASPGRHGRRRGHQAGTARR
jgi:hypothetical protein